LQLGAWIVLILRKLLNDRGGRAVNGFLFLGLLMNAVPFLSGVLFTLRFGLAVPAVRAPSVVTRIQPLLFTVTMTLPPPLHLTQNPSSTP